MKAIGGKWMHGLVAATALTASLALVGCSQEADSQERDVDVVAEVSSSAVYDRSETYEMERQRQIDIMKNAIEEKGRRVAREVAAKEAAEQEQVEQEQVEPVVEREESVVEGQVLEGWTLDVMEDSWVYEEPVESQDMYVGVDASEPVYEQSYGGSVDGFQSAGVIYGDDGTRYTWYSENVLPGGGLNELNSNGRHVGDGGYVMDGDGYIAVASSDYEIGTVLDTPFGEAKVYDTGCASGTVDVYTSW